MPDAVEPHLPGVYLLEVVELAGRWKVGAGELLAGLPLSMAELRDPAFRVPIRLCAEVVERAHRLTREPALALYMGTQMRLSSHGFLGFAAMTAGTLGEAIELAVRFSSTRTTAIGLALHVEGETASIVIEERAPLGALREFAVLSLVVGLWNIGQGLTGRPPEGIAECSFPAPDYAAGMPLAGMVRFGRPANRLIFASALLATPLETADPVALQLARAQCERELAALVDAGLVGRVRAALAAEGPGFPTLGEVARRLHMSTRTLKRKLADQGTTFTALLDDLRRQRALLLLENRDLTIADVAGRLGYTEVPNFTRAFRKWTGTTPAAYRARARE
jgi:AraC-like DNA-binding protein